MAKNSVQVYPKLVTFTVSLKIRLPCLAAELSGAFISQQAGFVTLEILQGFLVVMNSVKQALMELGLHIPSEIYISAKYSRQSFYFCN